MSLGLLDLRPIVLIKPIINPVESVRNTNEFPGFDQVIHVAHHEWHGIRNCTAALPGHKLLITADHELTHDDITEVLRQLKKLNIKKVVFQGYSSNADKLLLRIVARFARAIDCYAVTHVTTTQFEHLFEIEQQRRLLTRLHYGAIKRLGSVKPDFGAALEGYWGGTLINMAPNLDNALRVKKSPEISVYAPLDMGWRKNMYTNLIAACTCDNIQWVKTSNYPEGLADIFNLSKLVMTGYLRGQALLEEMGRSHAVLVATLAECQPMTQLEAFAMGTPALTGPLHLSEFDKDPLMDLCTTTNLDNPYLLSKDIHRLVDAASSDPVAMEEMVAGHLKARHEKAAQRFLEFLEI